MKMKKIIITLLAVLVLLACLPVSAANNELVLKRAVQINDRQIVMEFSEAVAINLHGDNRGPYIAVRLVNNSGGTTRYDRADVLDPSYNNPLQWTGSIEFADEKHDRLIWTISTSSRFGINTVRDIVNYSGALADYTDRRVAIAIEEVPFDETVVAAGDGICNISNEAGDVFLTPTLPSGWERIVVPIEVNYSYPIDLAKCEPVDRVQPLEYEGSLISYGEYEELQAEETVQVLRNNVWFVVAILGGYVALSVLVVLIIRIIKKRRG